MASCNGVAHAVSLLRTYTQAAFSFTADQVEACDARQASDVLAANYSANRLAVDNRSIPLALIEAACVDFHGCMPARPLRFDAMLQAGGTAQMRWIGFLNLLMTYMIGPEPTPDARTLEFLQQSALFTLMHALHADHGAGFGPQPLMPRHVKRAEGYMREHLRDDIKLTDIASAAGGQRALLERRLSARASAVSHAVR